MKPGNLVTCVSAIGDLVVGRAYLITKVFGPAPKTGLIQVNVIPNDTNHKAPPDDFVFDADRFKVLKVDG